MQIHPTEQNENTSNPTERRKDPLGGPDNRTTVEVTEEAGGRSQWEPAQQAQASGGCGADHRACAELSVSRVSPLMCVFCVCHSQKWAERASGMEHTHQETNRSVTFVSFHRRRLIMSETKRAERGTSSASLQGRNGFLSVQSRT